MLPQMIEEKLKLNFPDCELQITDLTGGGDHYSVNIRSNTFSGLSLIQQHQKVYAALDELLKGPLHALQIQTSDFKKSSER